MTSETPPAEPGPIVIRLSPRDQLMLAKALLEEDGDFKPNEFMGKVLENYRKSVISK